MFEHTLIKTSGNWAMENSYFIRAIMKAPMKPSFIIWAWLWA